MSGSTHHDHRHSLDRPLSAFSNIDFLIDCMQVVHDSRSCRVSIGPLLASVMQYASTTLDGPISSTSTRPWPAGAAEVDFTRCGHDRHLWK
jgi:hypothetical protein